MNIYDIAYGFAVGISSPVWMLRKKSRTKVLRAFRERMGRDIARGEDSPAIMIHAVSLGEINATRALVEMLRCKRSDLQITISTTTDTGFARGREIYGPMRGVTVIRYPLDFTIANRRVLDARKPSVVVLMELEFWPNFIRECHTRGIAVILANGRLTESSFKKYRLIKPIFAKMMRRTTELCVQDESYAQKFIALGATREQISVVGTMKFDTAQIGDHVDGEEALARDLNLSKKLWVCGSTGPGEEEIVLRVFKKLAIPDLQLAIIPRHPQRFDEVARLIESTGFECLRRSQLASKPGAEPRAFRAESAPIILGDTMGELRKFYSLATVVFVGRTLVDLGSKQHGSDMIEPAALGKPTIVGPFTGNFAEVMRQFREAKAIVEVPDESTLAAALTALLKNPDEAKSLGERARAAVARGQGATARHAQIILDLLK